VIRAVLDTDVVASGLLFQGAASVLPAAWQMRRFAFLVSAALLDEYARVLHYPRFHLTVDRIRYLVEDELLPFITPVKVTRTPRVIRADPLDNHLLACAVAGYADVLVSGDHHLLGLSRYRGILIISLASFVERLGS
jgi:putative PIN family toxin of toxin-antitoxin system